MPEMTCLPARIPVPGGDPVSALINVPDPCPETIPRGFILAHGAANSKENPLLEYLARGLAQAGFLALRFNFAYRDLGKKSPDNQKKLEATWLAVFDFLKNHPQYKMEKIVAGGKSLGGRVAAQLAARGELPADQLAFFGYPLHAPGKKDKPKDAHLYEIQQPMLFFAGTRDSLCNLDKLKEVLGRFATPARLYVVEGGDHSFKMPKTSGLSQEEVYEGILMDTLGWIGEAV